jgi:hypothetical protein
VYKIVWMSLQDVAGIKPIIYPPPTSPLDLLRRPELLGPASDKRLSEFAFLVKGEPHTLATSAVCWKYDRLEACSVIRSVGEPLGALLISKTQHSTEPRPEYSLPIDEDQGI